MEMLGNEFNMILSMQINLTQYEGMERGWGGQRQFTAMMLVNIIQNEFICERFSN